MSPCKLRVPVSGPALVRRAEASSHSDGGIGMGETLPLTPSDYWLPQGTLPGLSGCALDALIRTEDDDTFCMLLWHTQQHMHMALIRSISMGHCTEDPSHVEPFLEQVPAIDRIWPFLRALSAAAPGCGRALLIPSIPPASL